MESGLPTYEQIENYLNSLDPRFRKHAEKYISDLLVHGSLQSYLDYVKDNYKDGSARHIYGILHRLYSINGLTWPYRKSDIPTIAERSVFAPILDPEVIITMIEAAKKNKLTARLTFYLAISTVYGCRRIELANLSKRDIDIKNRLIYIATKKHGRERYHLIPEEIVPYISKFLPRLTPVKEKTMERMFRYIEDVISFPHVKDVGWHSIRRCLDRELLRANLPEDVVTDFLRWKRSSVNMPLRYARGTVISWETKYEDISIQDRSIDETVFKAHPFLPYWAS